MTRITNFGRKRSHVEATFSYNEAGLEDPDEGGPAGESAVTNTEGIEATEDGRGANEQPPKKKRKRGPRKKAGTKVAIGTADGGEGGEEGEVDGDGVEKRSNEAPKQKGNKNKGKSRALQGSPPSTTPAYPEFTLTPSRAQRSFGKTASQASSRTERQHYLFRLSREGSRRTGLPKNRRWIHQTTRKPKRLQCGHSRRDLLSLRFAKTPTLGLPREGL